ncbi:hypothetical protein [Staphylococcus aureus]|uniref:hypothetical protein n=1 Tax=Staphylococcus aureus TaxID=1280 RepID=UPI00301BE958
MPDHAPRMRLATHEVTNQPAAPGDRDLFGEDLPLREALAREMAEAPADAESWGARTS